MNCQPSNLVTCQCPAIISKHLPCSCLRHGYKLSGNREARNIGKLTTEFPSGRVLGLKSTCIKGVERIRGRPQRHLLLIRCCGGRAQPNKGRAFCPLAPMERTFLDLYETDDLHTRTSYMVYPAIPCKAKYEIQLPINHETAFANQSTSDKEGFTFKRPTSKPQRVPPPRTNPLLLYAPY
jgi:hypothetical protein